MLPRHSHLILRCRGAVLLGKHRLLRPAGLHLQMGCLDRQTQPQRCTPAVSPECDCGAQCSFREAQAKKEQFKAAIPALMQVESPVCSSPPATEPACGCRCQHAHHARSAACRCRIQARLPVGPLTAAVTDPVFRGRRQWQEAVLEEARRTSQITTLGGRRRCFSRLASTNRGASLLRDRSCDSPHTQRALQWRAQCRTCGAGRGHAMSCLPASNVHMAQTVGIDWVRTTGCPDVWIRAIRPTALRQRRRRRTSGRRSTRCARAAAPT